jgi:hypothetical protein
MLFLLRHFNINIAQIPVEFSTLTMSKEGIEDCRENKYTPTILNDDTRRCMYNSNVPGFRIILNTKYSNPLFPALDTFYKDEKALSMGLQESVNHKVRVYKHDNYYTILTNSWTWTMARKIIALMPKLFPQIKLNDEILEIFRLFGGDNYDAWCDTFNNWIQSLHLLDKIKQDQLKTALNQHRMTNIANLKKYIADCDKNINNFVDTIRQYIQDKTEYQCQLFGYESQQTDDGEELYNYLCKNKAIKSFTIGTDNVLRLLIQTPWNYYDQEMFNKVLANPYSDMHNYEHLPEVFQRIYNEKPRFELWTDASVYIKLTENRFGVDNTSKCKLLPQVHLHYFTCWGNNAGYIQKALSNKNYIGAIEQIIAAARNINWYDTPVIKRTAYLLNEDYEAIKTIKDLKTSEFISYLDAINIIEKEIKENEIHKNNPGTETNDTAEIPVAIG